MSSLVACRCPCPSCFARGSVYTFLFMPENRLRSLTLGLLIMWESMYLPGGSRHSPEPTLDLECFIDV